jgi:hypothetical protein
VDHSSDGHDDVIVPVATRKHNSDGHDDVISPVTMPVATDNVCR